MSFGEALLRRHGWTRIRTGVLFVLGFLVLDQGVVPLLKDHREQEICGSVVERVCTLMGPDCTKLRVQSAGERGVPKRRRCEHMNQLLNEVESLPPEERVPAIRLALSEAFGR
jgi:hypothetical protein